MRLDTNKERRAYWESVMQTYSAAELEKALDALPNDIAAVIKYHYLYNLSFEKIAVKLERPITVIRNRHNLGVLKLAQYFGDIQPL